MGDESDTAGSLDDVPDYRVDRDVGYPIAGMAVAISTLALVVALAALVTAARSRS